MSKRRVWCCGVACWIVWDEFAVTLKGALSLSKGEEREAIKLVCSSEETIMAIA